jgi:hypothetical protein
MTVVTSYNNLTAHYNKIIPRMGSSSKADDDDANHDATTGVAALEGGLRELTQGSTVRYAKVTHDMEVSF